VFKKLQFLGFVFLLLGHIAISQSRDSYVIMISIDGMRNDYTEIHDAINLKQFASSGAIAKSMLPSFPSKTFPNHYTLVTGMYPEHHGIIANTFYDPASKMTYRGSNPNTVQDGKWYGGTPLWVVAEQQNIKTGCYFWIGSEAEIQDVRPSYYKSYDENIPETKRVEQVVDWLKLPESDRPRFITLYFELVDDAGHNFGPLAPETKSTVQQIDSIIGQLNDQVAKLNLPVNFVLVSDHGMIQVDQENPIDITGILPKEGVTVVPGDTFILLHSEDENLIDETYNNLKLFARDFDVYKKGFLPDNFHFNSTPLAGDLTLIARAPKVFGIMGSAIKPGAHGYNSTIPEMGGSFIAWGPDIKKDITIEPFENIHVFPLIARILNLDISSLEIDGRLEVLKEILKED
jgi:predicted AlkP superfamily pyrophosphatase or phosphodiesterase